MSVNDARAATPGCCGARNLHQRLWEPATLQSPAQRLPTLQGGAWRTSLRASPPLAAEPPPSPPPPAGGFAAPPPPPPLEGSVSSSLELLQPMSERTETPREQKLSHWQGCAACIRSVRVNGEVHGGTTGGGWKVVDLRRTMVGSARRSGGPKDVVWRPICLPQARPRLSAPPAPRGNKACPHQPPWVWRREGSNTPSPLARL